MYDDGEMSKYYEKGWDQEESTHKPKECTGKVYGLKPSSVVSVLATIGGLVAALGMPIAGSIVDATDKRHSFGVACAWILVISNAAMCFLTRATWFAMTLLQAVVATFSFYGVSLVVYAYLPELFDNEAECVRVTSVGRTYEQAGMLVLIVLTTGISLGMGLDVVGTAVVAQVNTHDKVVFVCVMLTFTPLFCYLLSCDCLRLLAFASSPWKILAVVLGAPTLLNAFRLYRPRKANRQVAEGRWLLADGFLQQVS
jgi:MFS family permease